MLLWTHKDILAAHCSHVMFRRSQYTQRTSVNCSHGSVGGLLAGRLRSWGAAGPPGQLEIRLITQNSCSARPHNSCREGTNTEQSSGLRIWSTIQNSCKQPAFRPIGNKVNYPNPCSARANFKDKTENLVSVRIN